MVEIWKSTVVMATGRPWNKTPMPPRRKGERSQTKLEDQHRSCVWL